MENFSAEQQEEMKNMEEKLNKLIVPGFESIGVVAFVSQFCFLTECDNATRIRNAIKSFYVSYCESYGDNIVNDVSYESRLKEAIVSDLYGVNLEYENEILSAGSVDVNFNNDHVEEMDYSTMCEIVNKILISKHFSLTMFNFLRSFLDQEDRLIESKYE